MRQATEILARRKGKDIIEIGVHFEKYRSELEEILRGMGADTSMSVRGKIFLVILALFLLWLLKQAL